MDVLALVSAEALAANRAAPLLTDDGVRVALERMAALIRERRDEIAVANRADVEAADAELRAVFAQQYPEAWGRIQARRAFMQDVLGIQLKPEVLPFSNIPAYLPPFWLSSQQAMRLV